jgi:hypothetical protein
MDSVTSKRSDLGLSLPEFDEDLHRRARLVRVDAAHREADVDKYPIADASFDGVRVVDDAGQVDLAPDPADVRRRKFPFDVVDFDDLAGDPEAHWMLLLAMHVMSSWGPPYRSRGK